MLHCRWWQISNWHLWRTSGVVPLEGHYIHVSQHTVHVSYSLSSLPRLTCEATIPTPIIKTNIFENALTNTPNPRPSIPPKLICLIAAGFKLLPPSLLIGTFASFPWLYGDVEKSGLESWRAWVGFAKNGNAHAVAVTDVIRNGLCRRVIAAVFAWARCGSCLSKDGAEEENCFDGASPIVKGLQPVNGLNAVRNILSYWGRLMQSAIVAARLVSNEHLWNELAAEMSWSSSYTISSTKWVAMIVLWNR